MKSSVEAINLSIKLLNEAIQNVKNEKVLKFNLWMVGSELDYAALALSLFNNLIDFNPSLNSFSFNSIEEALIKAQSLLKEALLNIQEPKTAYEKIKQAIKLVKEVNAII
ncbi:hypothetical protein KEJ50_05175 [Candidatus Bathyarchaeota archaeon]|nr:hypothetical protein [Candidatus Bathyarchaeota archaeon]